MTEYHTPENEAPIDRLYVFMSVDDQGRHGIVAHALPGLGAMPMVFGKRSLARKMIPVAQKIAEKTGKRIGLFTFERTRGEELWQSE